MTFRNNDGTDGIHLNMGAAATTSHYLLPAGGQVTFVGAGAWYAIATANTPALSVMDEYD